MGPRLVVFLAETVKRLLLRPPVGGRRTRRLLLQGAMHALVPPILLRMSRRDAQLHPPHRQPRQPRYRPRGERRAVVAAHRFWHSILAKCRFADRPHPLVIRL